ncbi:MAG: thioredoxin family protein [Myxococcaceae bacterium]|nr:thioredoxin family protein [Myxococcaceae bacterium]
MNALLLAAVLTAASAPLKFVENDYPKALAEAKKAKVPLFVDATAPWCHTCIFMREHVLNRPELGVLQKRFVFLSLDTERPNSAAFLEKYPVDTWPTLLIIDSQSDKVALQWLGSANVEQFKKLLEDGEQAAKALGAQSAADPLLQKLAEADVLSGQRQPKAAAEAYRAVLAAAPADWPKRPRVTESLLGELYAAKQSEDCARTAAALVPALPRGPSFANATMWGLSCATAGSEKDAWRKDTEAPLVALAKEAVELPGLLADDRSGLYELLVDAAGDGEASVKLGQAWLTFLEGEAKAAKTPAARAVFDPHRVNAALAAHEPARVVDALKQSEKDLPKDYNAAARLAVVYRELGQLDDGLKACDRALAKVYGPRTLRVLETKASILAKKGDLPGQRAVLTKALETARALPQSQKPKGAQERIEKALTALPQG